MEWYYILLIALFIISLLFFGITYICYLITFYVNRKKEKLKDEFELPPGEVYLQFKEVITNAMKNAQKMECQNFYITSFDGLKLHAKYYEYEKDAPIEIMFHGYRGSALRDMSNGIERCFKMKHNALIIDQRCSNESEGHTISFGINEHKDCLSWIDFVINHFGENSRLILTGISMGAATVVMVANYDLPKNVIGILADCGYDSPKNIIKKVIKQIKLPPFIFYPFVKLGAKIFGRFNLEAYSSIEAVKNAKVPIIFFHGDTDTLVPYEMSNNLYELCNQKKRLVIIPNAGHGVAYLVDPDKYIQEFEDFLK